MGEKVIVVLDRAAIAAWSDSQTAAVAEAAIERKVNAALDRDREELIEQAVDRAELTSSRQHLRGPEAREGYRARLREVIEAALRAIERADQEDGNDA